MNYSNQLKWNLYYSQQVVTQKSKTILSNLLLFVFVYQRVSDGFVGRFGIVKIEAY